jgi:hypothetical protein
MKKKFLYVAGFILATGSLYALDAWNIGAAVELNANSRKGVATGGGFLFDLEIDERFSAGIKTSFFSDINTVNTLEWQGLFRYYLPLPVTGVFVQAETGMSIFFEQSEAFPAFLGGITAGWRIFPGKNWYLEPALRFGYPFIWSVGFGGGMRFEIGGRTNEQ